MTSEQINQIILQECAMEEMDSFQMSTNMKQINQIILQECVMEDIDDGYMEVDDSVEDMELDYEIEDVEMTIVWNWATPPYF